MFSFVYTLWEKIMGVGEAKTTTVKLSGAGSGELLEKLGGLFVAATDACQAYAAGSVKRMQAEDLNLQNLQRSKQRLESEVRTLEQRKKTLQSQPPPQQKQQLKGGPGTKPLSPEQEAKRQFEAEQRHKAAAEAERSKPLTQKPFEGLMLQVSAEGQEEEVQQS